MAKPSPMDSIRPGIHIHSPDTQADRWRTYALLREKHPVCQVEPDGAWAVSRFDDVRRVLQDYDCFSKDASIEFVDFASSDEEERRPRLIIGQDPPEHGKYRGLIEHAFRRRAIKSLIPPMREQAELLLTQFDQESPRDFVEHFAYPFVGMVIARIFGLDSKQTPTELRQWIELEQQVTVTTSDEAYGNKCQAATVRQNRYFQQLMAERRTDPQYDLITDLVSAELDGSMLSDADICEMLCMLVPAGYSTTIPMLCHALILLARRPDVLAELKASPQLIPAFIEELLRYSPSVLLTLRRTIRPVTLSGIEIPADQLVVALLAAANRDPREFENPEVFDLHRPRNRHLAFGAGIHVCVAAALVRLELTILLETVLSRCTQIECPADDDLSWTNGQTVYGVFDLPVRFC